MQVMVNAADTERPSPRYADIDVWAPRDALDAMIEGQLAAVAAVRAARAAIEQAALAMEARLRDGGRLIYAGAGTSGRLAVQDGAELMPTFSWPPERLLLLIAGGSDALMQAVEGAEDEAAKAVEVIHRHGVSSADVLIAVAPAAPRRSRSPACARRAAGASPSASPTTRHAAAEARSTRSCSTPGRSRSPARRA
jgi:N-acetylmuramic acid 6-phosphate etherase